MTDDGMHLQLRAIALHNDDAIRLLEELLDSPDGDGQRDLIADLLLLHRDRAAALAAVLASPFASARPDRGRAMEHTG